MTEQNPATLQNRIWEVVNAAWELCDDTANSDPPEVPQENWDKLAKALEALEQLIPDDETASAGYAVTMAFEALGQKLEGSRKLLTAAAHALRSYQYGNASPDLAESTANAIDVALAPAKAAS